MLTDITAIHAQLVSRLHAFNQMWPEWVVSAQVWQLPLLAEQKAPDLIEAHPLKGPLRLKQRCAR